MNAEALQRRLGDALGDRAAAVRVVADEALRAGVRAFLVGGPVRDLLLGRPVGDVDILLSDRFETVAKRSASRLGCPVRLHARFLTATLDSTPGRIDLSRARRERYARPGALPDVEAAPLGEDFARRDFSVHAMALPLDARFGRELVDPLGGREDLKHLRLRCLHDASFRDDPTRLLRGARYAARLRFRYAPQTARLVRDAVEDRLLDRVSGDRVRHELERMFEEDEPERVAAAMQRSRLFDAISPGWSLGSDRALTPDLRRALRRLGRARAAAPWPECAGADVRLGSGLRLLVGAAGSRTRLRLIERLGIRGRPAEQLRSDVGRLPSLVRGLDRAVAPGRLDARLSELSDALLLVLWCVGSVRVQRHVVRYASTLRHAPSPLSGDYALALGLAGADVGEFLSAGRERALDGHAVDEAWQRRWLARRRRMG